MKDIRGKSLQPGEFFFNAHVGCHELDLAYV